MMKFKAYAPIAGIAAVVLASAACLVFGFMSRKKVKKAFFKLW
ncbi:hypothetical protein [Paenibacillus aquistagni]|nr:hypothetical protein [Paenibacillus aquistagni]